jgi:predicted transcriptional regulator
LQVEFNATIKRKRGEIMTDVILLKKKIEESGMTMVAISKKSNILRETLYNRINGVGEFTATEIIALSKVLGLSNKERDQIFLREKLN